MLRQSNHRDQAGDDENGYVEGNGRTDKYQSEDEEQRIKNHSTRPLMDHLPPDLTAAYTRMPDPKTFAAGRPTLQVARNAAAVMGWLVGSVTAVAGGPADRPMGRAPSRRRSCRPHIAVRTRRRRSCSK